MLEQIKRMDLSHVEEVIKIEKECFLSPWSEKDFILELTSNPFAYYYVYLIDDKVVAFIGTWYNGENGEIVNVATSTKYRNQGIGRKLISYAMNKEAKCYSLEVRVSNEVAINLYESFGFKKVAYRKDYYSNHEDAYLMVKED